MKKKKIATPLLGLLPVLLIFLIFLYFSGCSKEKKPGRGKELQEAERTMSQSKRQFPKTIDGIYVFNDQLSSELTEAQYKFSASRYVGCQKVTRKQAKKLRKHNPNFIILHYRLGIGLGYKDSGGQWIQVIEGNNWVNEWPGDDEVKDEWFFKWRGKRVKDLQWGWYLMDLNNSGWRQYWSSEVLKQMKANQNDGVFADSFSVPNFFGGGNFAPPLPDIDAKFERNWTRRLEDFITFVKTTFGDDYYLIPNAGSLITTRDKTDYLVADGIMIEGFAAEGTESYYELSDWKLQMDRILSLTSEDKVIIAQSYLSKPDEIDLRLFYLSNYLLVKGRYSYVNIDYSFEPEFFPEYEVQLGPPQGDLPSHITKLFEKDWGVFARYYQNGLVLVNPSSKAKEVSFESTYYLVKPQGGGLVGSDRDIEGWFVDYEPVNNINLGPHQGAILVKEK